MTSRQKQFDAATLEILWMRLVSVVDEAARMLVRSSFSAVVRESNDFACIVTDAEGRSLVQSSFSIPSFIGTLPQTVKHFLEVFPASELSPGDVIITNDAWLGTGHLPDISVARPIFKGGKLRGFAASVAHSPDIGGRIRSPEARSIFEEGLQIPVMKAVSAGVENATLFAILRKNVRVPEDVIGDLYAQFSALELMEQRFLTLMDEHDLDSIESLAETIQSRSETAMRLAISAIPDGCYRSAVQTDGLEKPIEVKMALTVQGDTIDVDLDGSSPQVDRAINVALCYTKAYIAYGIKTVLSPDIPNNDGAFRPIEVKAPAGSIVNSVYPAPGGARALVGHYLPMLVIECLGQVVPEKVMAGAGAPIWCMNEAGIREDGSPYANVYFFNGGMGASPNRSGHHVLSWPSNIAGTPVEVMERRSPLRVDFKRIRDDAGGEGLHRGGNGQEISMTSKADRPISVSFMAERTRFGAAGMAGGSAGQTGEVLISGHKADTRLQHSINPGETILLRTPAGGGFGQAQSKSGDR
jgi:N-methylhydantoinase B